MKFLFCFILFFSVYLSIAQLTKLKTFQKEFSFTTDNDAYLFHRSDRYYTNGIFINLRTVSQKNNIRLIKEYQIAQMMFTPKSTQIKNTKNIDRSFCGYLFAGYSQTHFLSNKQLIKWYLSVGTIGKNSMAENLQNSLHKLTGLYLVNGWKYQVQQGFSINTGISYMPTLFYQSANKNLIKMIPVLEANFGNVFINLKAGATICFGNFENTNHSILYNASLHNQSASLKRNYELFFYYHPQIILQGFNATVQGNMFGNADSSQPKNVEIIVLQQTLGIAFSKGRWGNKIEINFQTKECTSQEIPHAYGSLQFAYRFN